MQFLKVEKWYPSTKLFIYSRRENPPISILLAITMPKVVIN